VVQVEDELLSYQAELEATVAELGQTEAKRIEALQVIFSASTLAFPPLLRNWIMSIRLRNTTVMRCYQCCGSGQIRTFVIGSGRLGPDPNPEPDLNK
jgi:hypothetical protein